MGRGGARRRLPAVVANDDVSTGGAGCGDSRLEGRKRALPLGFGLRNGCKKAVGTRRGYEAAEGCSLQSLSPIRRGPASVEISAVGVWARAVLALQAKTSPLR